MSDAETDHWEGASDDGRAKDSDSSCVDHSRENIEDKENPEIESPFFGVAFDQGFTSVSSIFSAKTEKWIFKDIGQDNQEE